MRERLGWSWLTLAQFKEKLLREGTMKRGIINLTILACAALFGGCATILDGSTQEMSFQSSPDSVVVTLTRTVKVVTQMSTDRNRPTQYTSHEETRVLGKTPFTLQLDRAQDQSVAFSKDGYKPVTMKLTTTTNGAFWGNILFGGLPGSTTDSMSGAIYEYAPSQLFVTLNPDTSTAIDQGTGQPQRDKALAFIVRRYPSLMANLSQGNGEDWSALRSLLRIEQGQESDALKKIRALAMVYPDAAAFANHVSDLYLK
jgi:hypothetical protein